MSNTPSIRYQWNTYTNGMLDLGRSEASTLARDGQCQVNEDAAHILLQNPHNVGMVFLRDMGFPNEGRIVWVAKRHLVVNEAPTPLHILEEDHSSSRPRFPIGHLKR